MYPRVTLMQRSYMESQEREEGTKLPAIREGRSSTMNFIRPDLAPISNSSDFSHSTTSSCSPCSSGSPCSTDLRSTQIPVPLSSKDLELKNNNDEMMAIEALGQLKNSIASTCSSPPMIDERRDDAKDTSNLVTDNRIGDNNGNVCNSANNDNGVYNVSGGSLGDTVNGQIGYNAGSVDNAGNAGNGNGNVGSGDDNDNIGGGSGGSGGGDGDGDYDYNDGEGGSQQYYDTTEITSLLNEKSSKRAKLFRKVKNHPIYHSAVRAYHSNKPTIIKGVEMVERATLPMVNMIGQRKSEWKRKRRLSKTSEMFPEDLGLSQKRRELQLPSISEALGLGDNKNLNDFTSKMSINSKSRLKTGLELLILVNKHISAKVLYLQNAIAKEQERNENAKEIIYSQQRDLEEDETVKKIQEDIVNTIRKAISVISKFAGSSLPEPERSHVRETLLILPTRWLTQSRSGANAILNYNTNRSVLILAQVSLDAVRSVMSIFDDTLANAEVWVEKKQEEQLARQAILRRSTIEREND